jgi:hypothetical protein
MTLGLDGQTIARLDAFRKKRNVSDYERAGAVSEKEAEELVALAERLRAQFVHWLKATHPELLPKGL